MSRNPDIVQVFWLREYMERVGCGTDGIVAWCREAGLPEYQEQYMVSERQGRRDLKELVEAGYLNREGKGRATVFVRLDKAVNSAKPGHP